MVRKHWQGGWLLCGLVAVKSVATPAVVARAVPLAPSQEARTRWAPLQIRDEPTTDDIRLASFFDDPLMPTREASSAENEDLLLAVQSFARRSVRDDFSSLTAFMDLHPDNPWALAVEFQLGREFYRTGHFSRAIATWKGAWESAKSAREEPAVILSNKSASELALMYARLGRMAELRALLGELQTRPEHGKLKRAIRGASDGLWSMEHQPEVSFRCGPLALDRICFATDRGKAGSQLIEDSHSTTNGFSAAQLAELSRKLGLNYQVAFRAPGAEIILPAVVHWKVGHYGALIARDGALLRVDDPTCGNKTWLSDDALDDEASGYFLVHSGPLPQGWRAASSEEANQVWGKGTTFLSWLLALLGIDPKAHPECDDKAMAVWNVHLLLASLHVQDTPLSYTPPVGPPMNFTVSYDSAGAQNLPSVPYSNIAADWRINWLTYITDDPMNPAGDIHFEANNGGTMVFTDYSATNQAFQNLFYNAATLVRTSTNSYEVRYPDGSKRIFDLPDGAVGTARKIFMTAVVDPAGNAATIQFDFPGRIASITDAIGQKTTLFYESTYTNYVLDGRGGFITLVYTNPLVVSRVMDPFGRTAQFQSVTYSSDGSYVYMTNIVDSLGLTSNFTGDALTTPYGTTRFSFGSYTGLYRANWIEITHPNGEKERVEYSEKTPAQIFSSEPLSIVPKGVLVRNYILWARNTYYWDRKAYAQGYSPNDYRGARIYHWTHALDYTTASPILESIKQPLEHRVWFNYDGQVNATFAGDSDKPTKVARTMEDGTTQLSQYEYNPLGNLTRSVDPLGRTFTFLFATNDVDLLEVRQTRAGNNELLFRATYNSQHRPLTVAGSDGQITTYTYNDRGQMLTATDPLGAQTTLVYDTNGYLVSIDGPLTGTNDTSRFTYDAIGRMRTATDVDGYTLAFDYDNLNRLTTITYPDGTFQQVTYKWLDPAVVRDRAGRQTIYTHDNLRQLVSVQDPLGRVTRYQWCGCGGLESVIDPLGRLTSWVRDLQGRVQTKVYADGSQVHYDYDSATGWLKNINDEQNQITKLDYNLDGTLSQKSYFNAVIPTSAVKFTYDPDYRRPLAMQDTNGTTSYTYYPVTASPGLGAGRLASIQGPSPNNLIALAYDEVGRVISRTINGAAEKRTYDSAGRLTQLTNALGLFTYNWEGPSARLSTIQYPNGQHSQYAYFPDPSQPLVQRISHYLPNGSLLGQFTYAYNTARQITNWAQVQSSATNVWTATYDEADRLTGVTVGQGGTTVKTFGYTYDDADNRTLESLDTARHDFYYNALNQPISATNTPLPDVSYEWDAEQRLTAINVGSHRSEFSYDGRGHRIRIVEKDNGTATTDRRYVWYSDTLAEEYDASQGTLLKRYFANGFQVLAGGALPAGLYYYTRDHLGSVRSLTDQQANVQGVFEFDPFGQRTQTSGTLSSDAGFTGHFVHAPTGTYLTRFRVYDPRLARWLSRDPVRELTGLNMYAYVHGNPLNRRDALGLDDDAFSGQTGGAVNPSLSLNLGQFGLSLGSSILTPHDANLQFSFKLIDELSLTCDPVGHQYGLDFSIDPFDISGSFGPDSTQWSFSFNTESFSAGANLSVGYNGSFSAGVGIAGHF